MRDSQNITHEALIAEAAKLRVAGWSWSDIAEKVNRSPGTVRKWQYDFSDTWNEKLLTALDKAIPSYETIALRKLRHCANEETGRNQIQAAKELLRHARELRGTKQEITHKTDSDGLTFEVVYPDEDTDDPS